MFASAVPVPTSRPSHTSDNRSSLLFCIILSTPRPLIYATPTYLRHAHFSTPRPLFYATPTYLRHAHLSTPHSLIYATPTYLRHTHLSTPHPLIYDTPTHLRHTHLSTTHPLIYDTPTYLRHTHLSTTHPLIYGTPTYLRHTHLSTPHPHIYARVWRTTKIHTYLLELQMDLMECVLISIQNLITNLKIMFNIQQKIYRKLANKKKKKFYRQDGTERRWAPHRPGPSHE